MFEDCKVAIDSEIKLNLVSVHTKGHLKIVVCQSTTILYMLLMYDSYLLSTVETQRHYICHQQKNMGLCIDH
jgi:hypothetical protein